MSASVGTLGPGVVARSTASSVGDGSMICASGVGTGEVDDFVGGAIETDGACGKAVRRDGGRRRMTILVDFAVFDEALRPVEAVTVPVMVVDMEERS